MVFEALAAHLKKQFTYRDHGGDSEISVDIIDNSVEIVYHHFSGDTYGLSVGLDGGHAVVSDPCGDVDYDGDDKPAVVARVDLSDPDSIEELESAITDEIDNFKSQWDDEHGFND